MNSAPCRRTKSSCRSEKSTGRITPDVDFTLYGSPAPRCSHRSTPVNPRKLSQPPNTPNRAHKPRKPLRLPIEKILLLNEKIEFNKREKIRLELSSRQIKLLSEREDDRRCLDSGKTCSSAVDLSIDLSTVTNSDHESDTNSDDQEEFVQQAMQSKACSVPSTGTGSPSRYVWRLNNPANGSQPGSGRSTESEYPCSAATKISELSDRSVLNRSPKCFRSRSADLIHLYVNTVNDKEKLTKYFRPCHVCNNPCCICPDLVPESSRSFPTFSSVPAQESAKFNDKMVETDPEITEFVSATEPTAEAAMPDSGSDSSNSEFSNFLIERYLTKSGKVHRNDPDLAFDSGNSTLQLDESDGSSRPNRKKSIPLSVIQLATAAQCARILANSLESVLEIVDGETEECKDLIRFKGDDLNQLFETLLSLKSQYAEESGNEADDSRKTRNWADFEGISGSRQQRPDSFDDAFLGPVSTGKSTEFTFEDNFEDPPQSRNCLDGCTDGNAAG